ncbi:MAG: MFS transporter [Methanobacteriota archaeon]|nr:MAG: MFS transporter [Euryarchaeota archaeon]
MVTDCHGVIPVNLFPRINCSLLVPSNKGLYSIISSFQNLGERIMFSFVQLYADYNGASATEQGILASFRNILSFGGQQAFGRLSDKKGRSIVLLFGFLLSTLSSIALTGVSSPLLIILVYASYSLGFSAIQPSFSALIGDTYSREKQAQMLGQISSVGSLLGGLGFLIVGIASDLLVNPYPLLFIIAGISFGFAALSVIILSSTGKAPSQPIDQTAGTSLFEPLKVNYFRRYVLIDAIFGFAMSTAWPLFPKVTNALATTGQVTIMWAVTFLGFSVSAHLTPHLKKMFKSYRLSFYSSRFLLWLVPFSFAIATDWTHLLFARIIAGLTFGFYTTLQKDYALECARSSGQEEKKGWFLGTHAFFFGISTFIGSLLFGFIVDLLLTSTPFGYPEMFFISATFRFFLSFGYLKILPPNGDGVLTS